MVVEISIVGPCAFLMRNDAGVSGRNLWLVSPSRFQKANSMTPFRKRINQATQRMAEDMLIRNMAVRTIDSYTYHVDRFAKHFGKIPDDLGPEQIREFQLWLIQEKKCSWSSFNQAGSRRSPPADPVCGPSQTSTRTADTLCSRAETQRSNESQTSRHRLGANATANHSSQGTQGSLRATLSEAFGGVANLLEDRSSDPVSFSRQDQRRAALGRDGAESLQVRGRFGEYQENGHAAYAETFVRDRTAGSRSRSDGDQSADGGLGHSSFTTTMIYLHCRKQHLGSTPSPIDWLPARQCPRWIDPSLQNPSPRQTPSPAEETDLV